MKKIRKSIAFLYGDPVLFAAFAVAMFSALFVHPSKEYLAYLDFRVLSLLFSMMVVVAGFQKAGVFGFIVERLLKFVHNTRMLVFVFVGVCFFGSMLITNDVALITFVPLGIMTLTQTRKGKLLIPVIVLQTIAANLGSMLTPLGNPQNLYLYSVSNMTMGQFLWTMAMPSGISFLLLVAAIFFIKPERIEPPTEQQGKAVGRKKALLWCVLFFICLLAVLRILPYGIALAVVLAGAVIFDRKILLWVDYGLLLTFIFLFVFIGNMENIPVVSDTLSKLVDTREVTVAILLSQVISNVPASMLLSKFTANYSALLIGVNLGGLGTLIASMASVISYKLYAYTRGAKTGRYLAIFTAMNLLFLGVLWVSVVVLKGVTA
ncbi:MAG: SLC13 family permease [Anaerotignum sp.]|nr:SLC13 family permease [Anaerotignum sp.]